MKKLTEEMIFKKINPLIKDGMTNEQLLETKRLISYAIKSPSTKILKINLTFWFFNMYYFTIYLGKDKKKYIQRTKYGRVTKILLVVLTTSIMIFVAFSVLSAIFLALYYIKSLLGIDLFEAHLLK